MRLPIENITQLKQEGLPVFRNGTERPHKRVELKYFDSNRRSSKTSVTYAMSNYQRKVQTYSYTPSPWVNTGNSTSKYLTITISSDLYWCTHVEDVVLSKR